MKHVASFYKTMENGEVRCYLCPHRCLIGKGEQGFCGVRQNEEGTLYTTTYGEVVAQAIDPIEKKPFYHFLPGSRSYSIAARGCNLRCGFCQNWHISQTPETIEEKTAGIRMTPEQLADEAQKAGCASIAYTYSEPSIFLEYVIDTARVAREKGLRNVMVTNGYITSDALKTAAPYIDACNVDLKSFRDDFYRTTCHGRLRPVLRAIETMKEMGIWVEVTTLVIPDGNDSREELSNIASFLSNVDPSIPWHVSRFHSDFRMVDVQATPLSRLNLAVEVGKEAGLHYVYRGNIGEMESTHCPSCGDTIVDRSHDTVRADSIQDSSCTRCGWVVPGIWSNESEPVLRP